MDIHAIRRENFLKLLAECGNSNVKLARRIGTSEAYVSQIKTGWIRQTGKPTRIGDDIAKQAEKAFGLNDGWMDQRHLFDEPIEAFANRVADLRPEYQAIVRRQLEVLEDLQQAEQQPAEERPRSPP